MPSSIASGLILLTAAALEVAGDAVVRSGLRGGGFAMALVGCAMLAAYGVAVNLLGWDFSRSLGVYVAVFAAAAVLTGRFVFQDVVPASTWTGLAVIALGGLIIQFGPSLTK